MLSTAALYAIGSLWLVFRWDEFTFRSLKRYPPLPQIIEGSDDDDYDDDDDGDDDDDDDDDDDNVGEEENDC